jgi:3-hydroxyisobutyrate dehydrogenase-like beta-hydroxyacid dehydrogenase
MQKTVGIIGLGIMGSAMAGNLIKAGFRVVGYDIRRDPIDALVAQGGEATSSAREVAERTKVVITSMPSIAAFHDVVSGDDGLVQGGAEGLIVIETSTLPIEEKQKGCEALAETKKILLDCPLSGTGAQAATKDLVVLGSGNQEAFDACTTVFEGFARAQYYLGAFGNGSRMKFVANHLVNIHNVATAEAMVLGMKAGLDPQLIYDVITDSAGNSRIFELRAPMMVTGEYDDATMKIEVWQKDINVIGSFAAELHCPIPLFAAASEPYLAAMDQGLAKKDTAAVCAVLENLAGVERKS